MAFQTTVISCLFKIKSVPFFHVFFSSSMKTKSLNLCLDMTGGIYSTNETPTLTLVEVLND